MNSDKSILPFRAYSLAETAELIDMHPNSLRRKLAQPDDPFIMTSNPVKIGKEWRFMGENILKALGSASYANQTQERHNADNSGVVSAKNLNQDIR